MGDAAGSPWLVAEAGDVGRPSETLAGDVFQMLSSWRPTSGSSSVPSRETLISRFWFQGFRRCLTEEDGGSSARSTG